MEGALASAVAADEVTRLLAEGADVLMALVALAVRRLRLLIADAP